ncbi:phage tail protein [Stakelama tenebrarum]|uniref:Tip attachment protein J domain-containing protein n=1 Tax=Stakelama tenebrarum TaxID=2711215 RepID=A0A6G6Y5D8_9SPHN|nr:hypothetical protein [Sphingosinithalassobacter tenebrarum]QIG80120.1 hypothetical protein G5C33_10230 [Sphingosinithalassobacter tenebrarum]
MGKVLRIAGTVVAIAAAIPSGGTSLLAAGLGISATAASAIALGLNFVSALTASAPSASIGGAQTQWSADPDAPAPIAFGRTLVGGEIRYRKGHGKANKYETRVTIQSACGPIHSFEKVYADKAAVTFSGQTASTGKLHNRFWEVRQLGACPEASALVNQIGYPPAWTSAHKLSGYAASIDTFLFDGKGDDTFTQIPQFAWLLKGVKLYKPRLDASMPGGSGGHSVANEATREWGENPWDGAVTWALGWHQGANNIRVGGVGMPVASIDMPAFMDAANVAEANGWKFGGQVTTADSKWDVLKAICQAGGGEPIRSGALLSCIVNTPRIPIATITRADVIGEVSIRTAQTRRERPNGMIPRYRSEDHFWEVVPASVVRNVTYLAEDGAARTRELPLPLVQCTAGEDPTQAAQLTAYAVANAREAGPIVIPLKLRWFGFKTGDCLTIDSGYSEMGWLAGKNVVVLRRQLDPATGGVTLTVRTETDSKHPWALGQTGVAAPTTGVPELPDPTAPEPGEWSLLGTGIAGDGSAIPALKFFGAVDGGVARTIIFEYFQGDEPPSDPDNWVPAAQLGGATTSFTLTSVGAGLSYMGAVRYVYETGTSDRLVLGPVVTGTDANVLQALIVDSWTTGLSLSATDAGTDATITVSAHQRSYLDRGPIDVDAGSVSGLAYETQYFICYDDAARAGGSVSYLAVTDIADAGPTSAHPGRHYVGSVSTPASGGDPIDGGGGPPPWKTDPAL